MSNTVLAFAGLFVLGVVVMMMIVAPNIYMSVEEDAVANDIYNTSHGTTYTSGVEIAQGYVFGFSNVEIALIVILIIVISLSIVFAL